VNLAPVFLLFGGMVFGIGFLFGLCAGIGSSDDYWRKELQKRGHAEWRIIPGTNKTEYKWKDEQ
jgi:hypothetical protein